MYNKYNNIKGVEIMTDKIITISREFGSGGKYIGELVAEKLGIPCYDKSLIDKVADKTGLVKDFVEKLSEYSPGKSIFSYSFVGRNPGGESLEDYIIRIQSKIIKDLAGEGPCVIVGRSADYILRDFKNVVDVFIYGDREEKIKRIKDLKNVSLETAKKMLKETDKKRSINYKYYTGREWGNRENYALMLNSTKLGIENCADIICEMCR